MMGYTAPLVAGGMMVGVFTLMAANVSIEPEIGPQTVSSRTSAAQVSEASTAVTPIRIQDFLSSVSEPTVALADFVADEEVEVHYIPLARNQYVRTQ